MSKTSFIKIWISNYFESADYLKMSEIEFQKLISTIIKMNNNSEEKDKKLSIFFTSMSQFLMMEFTDVKLDLISIVLRIYIKFITGDMD